MQCPKLDELPLPPKGKSGWPWTVESAQLPAKMPNGEVWPRISLVTPSYNQGEYVEQTIRSVLLQGYPNLEYIIMDGGSTDRTVDIIQKYEPWLSYWISEKDDGQSSAINAGFRKSTGLVGNWLNSDDYLNLNALATLSIALRLQPHAGIYTGGRTVVSQDDVPLAMQLQWREKWQDYMFGIPDFPQEASFFKLALLQDLGGIAEDLQYMMDVDWYQRILNSRQSVCCIPFGFATLRRQPKMKTVSNDPSRLEELNAYSIRIANDWPRRSYAALKRFRLQSLFARALRARQLVSCVVVRYDGWQDQWVTYELRP